MKNLKLITIIVFIQFLFSCNKLDSNDKFTENWELAKSGNEELKSLGGIQNFELEIEKKDQFYIAKYKIKQNNKVIDYYELMKKHSTDSIQRVVFENMFRYTLSKDESMLMNVFEPNTNSIQFIDKEELIYFRNNTFGTIWLSRKQ